MRHRRVSTILSHHQPAPPLTDAELAAALDPVHDAILPSSGFAERVMAAVDREAGAPAPIPFPWLRALPGMTVTAIMLAVLFAALALTLRSPAAVSSANAAGQAFIAALLHQAGTARTLGLVFSAAVAGGCLLLCRRLLGAR